MNTNESMASNCEKIDKTTKYHSFSYEYYKLDGYFK